jgi:hypothetical protein
MVQRDAQHLSDGVDDGPETTRNQEDILSQLLQPLHQLWDACIGHNQRLCCSPLMPMPDFPVFCRCIEQPLLQVVTPVSAYLG